MGLVSRDFNPPHEDPRDDLYAAMPSLEAKKAWFAYVAETRRTWRNQEESEVKLIFVDVHTASHDVAKTKKKIGSNCWRN